MVKTELPTISMPNDRAWFHVTRHEELCQAEDWVKHPDVPKLYKFDRNNRAIITEVDVTRMSYGVEHQIRQLVETTKQFSFFRSLSAHDQTMLFSRNMHLNQRYDAQSDCYIPYAAVGHQILLPVTVMETFNSKYGCGNKHLLYYLKTFNQRMMFDWRLMVILMIIKLYETSVHMRLDNPLGIEEEQIYYKKALISHLRKNYDSTNNATHLYQDILQQVDQLTRGEAFFFNAVRMVPVEKRPSLLVELIDRHGEIKRTNFVKLSA